ncbi:MAG: DNA-directed DNA polymerase [Candidatus Pacearchaeota archaeon]
MKVEFFITQIDYIDIDNIDYIRLWGRTKDNKIVCIIDECEKYYYHLIDEKLKEKEIENLINEIKSISFEHAKRIVKPKKVEFVEKNLNGKKVKALKIYTYNHKDIIPLKDRIKVLKGIKEHEHKHDDINFITHYIIEKDIQPLYYYQAEIEENEITKKIKKPSVDIFGFLKEIKKINDDNYQPKILAFDIEATEFEVGKGEIVMISIYNDNIKKVLTSKKFETEDKWIEFVKNEEELIKKFIEIVKKEKPDYIVGYFSDGFDMPYLKARSKKHKIKLTLSLDESEITLKKGKISSAESKGGIAHIDLFRFIENFVAPSLKTETLTLNTVAKELIGEEKIKIDFEVIKNHKELKKFAEYNLQDSILVYKIFHKLWPQMLELSRIVKEPLEVTTRSSYSQLVEYYIIHNLKEFDEIIEHRPFSDVIEKRKLMPKYVGAFVLEPKPGIYENIAMFDFRSLYPSIIISYNISPGTITNKKTKYSTPEFELDGKKVKFYFEEDPGFIPILLKRLIETRKKVKEEKKKNPNPFLEARDLALKTLANAHYGYFGFFGARYYSRECAASVTALGRWHISEMIKKAKKENFDVIYADTDSLAVLLKEKTKESAIKWLKKVNEELPKDMELELEDFYKRVIFVTTRKGEIGAKKKYAMINEKNELKIRGFETVRRDWCDLAKKVQNYVIESILKEGKYEKALSYVEDIIKKLRKKEIDVKDLIIRSQLKKEIEEYEAHTPHVEIARRMQKAGIPVRAGSLIEWVVCEKSEKAKIREKVKMPSEVENKEYDVNYYINNQIVPAIESIFSIFGITSKDIIEGKKQKKLLEF